MHLKFIIDYVLKVPIKGMVRKLVMSEIEEQKMSKELDGIMKGLGGPMEQLDEKFNQLHHEHGATEQYLDIVTLEYSKTDLYVPPFDTIKRVIITHIFRFGSLSQFKFSII